MKIGSVTSTAAQSRKQTSAGCWEKLPTAFSVARPPQRTHKQYASRFELLAALLASLFEQPLSIQIQTRSRKDWAL
jgi:hypothetical protein